MEKQKFSFKDSIELLITYIFGIQVIIPIILSVLLAIYIASTGMAIEDINQTLLQFLVFFVGTTYLVFRTKDKLKEEWKKCKTDIATHTAKVAKNFLISLVLMAVVNISINAIFKLESSQNQQQIEEMFMQAPILITVMTVIFAPLMEEIVFRGGLYLGLKEKFSEDAAVLVSAVSFGAIHVLPSFLGSFDFVELVFILPYSLMGYYMVKSVNDTNSLFGGVLMHFMNNALAASVALFEVFK